MLGAWAVFSMASEMRTTGVKSGGSAPLFLSGDRYKLLRNTLFLSVGIVKSLRFDTSE